MHRWLLAVLIGIVLGLILATAPVGVGVAFAAVGLFIVFAPIDILLLPGAFRQRVGSVVVLGVLATMALFPWGSLAWFLFGRPARRREHERRAASERALDRV